MRAIFLNILESKWKELSFIFESWDFCLLWHDNIFNSFLTLGNGRGGKSKSLLIAPHLGARWPEDLYWDLPSVDDWAQLLPLFGQWLPAGMGSGLTVSCPHLETRAVLCILLGRYQANCTSEQAVFERWVSKSILKSVLNGVQSVLCSVVPTAWEPAAGSFSIFAAWPWACPATPGHRPASSEYFSTGKNPHEPFPLL